MQMGIRMLALCHIYAVETKDVDYRGAPWGIACDVRILKFEN